MKRTPDHRDYDRLADIFAIAYGRTLSIAEALKTVFEGDRRHRIYLRQTLGLDVIEETARKHGLSVTRMMTGGPATVYARARQEAWWRLRTELGLSYPAIGRLHGFDHSTVISGVRRHAQRIGKGAASVGPGRAVSDTPAPDADSVEPIVDTSFLLHGSPEAT